MKGKIFAGGAIILLALTSAWAADVAGKWTAHIAGAQGQGDSDITLVLKVVGDKVTGTINNTQAPGEIEIKDGKVTGDDVSFSMVRNIGGTETTVLWKGKIAGDEIKFTRTTQAAGGAAAPAGGAAPAGRGGGAGGGAATEIIAKRAK
jgi:hypothetical protein